MKIYHISDIHLNKEFLQDWKSYIKKAFISHVNKTKDANSFIVCTGDLIDKGGLDWSNATDGFKEFEKEIIKPILEETGITIDRFILCPGNHDIERDKDAPYVRTGLRGEIKEKGVTEINKYTSKIIDGDYSVSMRIKAYNDFVQALYADCPNVKTYNLGNTFKYKNEGETIGIAAFNSVWNSCDDSDRQNGLAIGELQYNQFNAILADCSVKIAAIHHPLDWFPYEKNSIISWMIKDYDLILMGHIHENDTGMSIKPSGSYAYNISPSFSKDIRGVTGTYVNGFTEIEMSADSQDVSCRYLIYNFKEREYKKNVDYTEDGEFEFSYRKDGSNLSALVTRCLKHIKTEHFPKIEANLIPQRASAIHSLDDAFVMPPLRRHGDEKQENYSISTLLNRPSNIVLFGNGESGKTVLLYKCLMDFVREHSIYQKIPVYLDFTSNTNQDFETIIKNYLSCSSREVDKLIESGRIVLLVDNYSVSLDYKERKSALYRFLAESQIKMIATVEYQLLDTIPLVFVEGNEIPVEVFFIHQFDAAKVKELMEKWSPQDDAKQRIDKIEKMVDRFCSYSLPCSAMSVSLYLWCTEDRSRAPINSAYLLDIYLDNILEKLAIENVYRDSFNYNNKCNLLGYIAYRCNKKLIDDPDYLLTKGTLISITEEYLSAVGYRQFQADKLVDYFIRQRIFIQEGNNVRYAHACFFYFFLAKRMISNIEFRKEVMSKENYYKYERVLDYYSGLALSDNEWLDELYKRFEDYFSNAYEEIKTIDIDDFFTIIENVDKNKRFIPLAKQISPTTIVGEKPTVHEVEKRSLAVSDERLRRITDKISRDEELSMSTLLVMMSKALRNLESVEDTVLKQKVYDSIIRNSLVYNVLNKNYLAEYANKHEGSLPPTYSDIQDVYTFLRFMPFIFQSNLYDVLGSQKLQQIVETKLDKDCLAGKSDVEKYLSLAMLWDIANVKYEKEFRRMIRSVGNNSVQDYLLMKLLYYFNNKVVLGSEPEKTYIDLIAEARVKVKRLGRYQKGKIVKEMEEERKRLMRERNQEK